MSDKKMQHVYRVRHPVLLAILSDICWLRDCIRQAQTDDRGGLARLLEAVDEKLNELFRGTLFQVSPLHAGMKLRLMPSETGDPLIFVLEDDGSEAAGDPQDDDFSLE